jgi:hypothetical protein
VSGEQIAIVRVGMLRMEILRYELWNSTAGHVTAMNATTATKNDEIDMNKSEPGSKTVSGAVLSKQCDGPTLPALVTTVLVARMFSPGYSRPREQIFEAFYCPDNVLTQYKKIISKA